MFDSVLNTLLKTSLSSVFYTVKIYRQSQIVRGLWANAILKTESRTVVFRGDFQNFAVFSIVSVFHDSVIRIIYLLVNLFRTNVFIVINSNSSNSKWSPVRPFMKATVMRIFLKVDIRNTRTSNASNKLTSFYQYGWLWNI